MYQSTPLKAAFYRHIQEKDFFNPRHKLLLAVSGGMDSMAMLHLLKGRYIKLAVAHCNFGLRGEESDGDEAFVKQQCKEWGVQCFSKQVDCANFAQENKMSVQEAARGLRYHWFEELLGENGFDFVLTAHHADDEVESFFLNLHRSSGGKGLQGIPEVRDKIIRPLLPFRKSEIQAYVEKEGINYRNDSSNAKTDYRRNALRLEILPLMEKHLPGMQQAVLKSMQHLREEQAFTLSTLEVILQEVIEEDEHHKVLNMSRLKHYPHPSFVLYRILNAFGFKREQSDAIWRAYESKQPSGKQFQAEMAWAILDRGKLRIRLEMSQDFESTFWQEGQVAQWHGWTFQMDTTPESEMNPRNYTGNRALVNASSICWPLRIRHWQEGDRMQPFGMQRHKLLSDLLVDAKIPLDQKKEIPVIEDANGRILWVVGLRLSECLRWKEGDAGLVLLGERK